MAYWDQFQPVTGQLIPNQPGGDFGLPRPPNTSGAASAIQQPAEPVRYGQGGGGFLAPSTSGGGVTGPNGPVAGTQDAPQGGGSTDYEATFRSLFPGESLSPETLAANESKLPPGWRLLGPNAAGQRSKIELPNGQVIDVIGGAGSGQNHLQWQETGGGGGGGLADSLGNFQTGSFTGGGQYPLASVMGTGLATPWTTPFVAPTGATEQNDPGYQFRLNEGIKAGERSAAAKGTLLTGGLQKALGRYAQDYASGEYGNVYNRALGEYQMAHNIFQENNGNLYNRLFNVASMGQSAAANQGNNATSYAQNMGNTVAGIGAAQGQGSAAQGQIWGNAAQGIGNAAGAYWMYNHPPPVHY